MKYLTDQFQLCFFALEALNSCILFLHWQHNWHPYKQLASCYICFVFAFRYAVVKWVFSYVSSVFKVWKSCDFN